MADSKQQSQQTKTEPGKCVSTDLVYVMGTLRCHKTGRRAFTWYGRREATFGELCDLARAKHTKLFDNSGATVRGITIKWPERDGTQQSLRLREKALEFAMTATLRLFGVVNNCDVTIDL